MKIIRNRRAVRGATLAETCISIAILGIMAAGIICSFNSGFFTLRMARENQRATQILLKYTETLRLLNWDQVNSTGTNGYIPSRIDDVYDPQGAVGKQGIPYTGSIVVSTNSGFSPTPNYNDSLRLITITLWWTNSVSTNLVRTRTVSTLIAKDGIQNYVW
jgi:type II secretory pathway pseudopilin PulG